MGEIEPQIDSTERVKCWRCSARFSVPRTVSRATCPKCQSQVALHRLSMPTMPTGRRGDVVRLPKVALPPDRTKKPLGMSVLQNLEAGPAEGEKPTPGEDLENEDGTELRIPFSAHRKVGEQRKMFVEAEPRRDGLGEGMDLPSGITLKTLIASVGIATLVLLLLIFAIES